MQLAPTCPDAMELLFTLKALRRNGLRKIVPNLKWSIPTTLNGDSSLCLIVPIYENHPTEALASVLPLSASR